jgi:hypothetical protein
MKGRTMPTDLPIRRDEQPERRDPGFRNLLIAATLLVSVLGLLCERSFGPTPGYSLAQNPTEIQLSP